MPIPDDMTHLSGAKRISVVIPDCVHQQLVKRSFKEGRSVSNLAAYLLERSLESDKY